MSFCVPPLYGILDTRYLPAERRARDMWLQRTVCELAGAGVSLLQLRAKGEQRVSIVRDAEAMRQAAGAGVQLIMNDYTDLVRETGFDGVHLGQGDLAVDRARTMLGCDALIGLSTHTPEQIGDGDRTGATYLAVGPVFATTSKPDAEPVVGLAGVRAARALTTKPLVAIGGIDIEGAEAVWAAGADSIAVIGALLGGPHPPGTMARDFLRLFR